MAQGNRDSVLIALVKWWRFGTTSARTGAQRVPSFTLIIFSQASGTSTRQRYGHSVAEKPGQKLID